MPKDGVMTGWRSICSGTRIPGTKRRMARVSRLAQWTLAKAASLSKTRDTDGSTTPVAIMASPLKAPLGMKRAKDGPPIKECSGAEHLWPMAMESDNGSIMSMKLHGFQGGRVGRGKVMDQVGKLRSPNAPS